jgi:hypothetical protein
VAGRINRVTPEFVTYVPDELEAGRVYVSIQYRVAVHPCCCGCGERVVTPLSPAQWAVAYDGENVSLNPSIAGGRCNSHYVIARGRVRWLPPLTKRQRRLAAERDQAALNRDFEAGPTMDPGAAPAQTKPPPSRWRRVFGALGITRQGR